ncbi:DUF6894 family protein [Sphingomonas xinjiangensis]|uniref:DUF6894 domain-containing protein n=1 Tax=Sphingomonas xinjiangensis TaxID=643568 RepID=A0A840YAY9_9SPHN|nr:hypothetical protein [Sphingomonas xinjiangensis]MBB5709455.1 hypothetical protein [Sphingomonas xinjiangensis]
MRYFFNFSDGTSVRDQVGQELPDHRAARASATEYAAQLMRDHPTMIWEGSNFRVEVSDRAGLILLTIIIVGVEASAARTP